MPKKLRPAIKCHGGKFYLSDWIISHFPSNYTELHYGEPFTGAGSCFLNKKPSQSEWLNDLDVGIMAIWNTLRDTPYQFLGRLNAVKYCEDTFNCALVAETQNLEGIELAINEFILRRMSRGGLKKAFGWSDRQRGGQPGDVNAFQTILQQLPLISRRVQGVELFNKPAVEVIREMDREDCVLYCDPPYVNETRQSQNTYEHDMTTEDHIELAEVLNQCKSKVILSGYPSPLYDKLFEGWRYEQRLVANHASQQKKKQYKQESLWLSY